MHSVVSRLCLTLLHSRAVSKVGKPRWGHPLVEFVIVGEICRKKEEMGKGCHKIVHADAFIHASKGRPHVVRSVQPLFTLPRGSTPRSIRERVEFLKLACLY